MKIFLISNMFPSATDGLFGVFVKNFKTELEKQDVVFSPVALIKGKAGSLLKKLTNYVNHYFKIIRGVFFSKYDLMYVHYISLHLPVLFTLLPFKRKPWVLNAHGNDMIDLQKNGFLNFLAKVLFKKTDLIVVPTSYFKEKTLKSYPFLEPEKIFISPSGGIDLQKFYKVPLDTTHHTLHTTQNSPLTLGFISRFVEEKGWKTFLDALVLLKGDNIPFKAIIAGKGPDEEKIKNYIQQKDLEELIDFRGFVPQEKLAELYNQCDLYIFPTYREAESLGLTGVEAMACGTPVVACNIAGPSTYVEHGNNGFLFEPKNHTALAGMIKKYIGLPSEDKNQFRNKALETAAKFEQSYVAHLLLKRLKSLINSSLKFS